MGLDPPMDDIEELKNRIDSFRFTTLVDVSIIQAGQTTRARSNMVFNNFINIHLDIVRLYRTWREIASPPAGPQTLLDSWDRLGIDHVVELCKHMLRGLNEYCTWFTKANTFRNHYEPASTEAHWAKSEEIVGITETLDVRHILWEVDRIIHKHLMSYGSRSSSSAGSATEDERDSGDSRDRASFAELQRHAARVPIPFHYYNGPPTRRNSRDGSTEQYHDSHTAAASPWSLELSTASGKPAYEPIHRQKPAVSWEKCSSSGLHCNGIAPHASVPRKARQVRLQRIATLGLNLVPVKHISSNNRSDVSTQSNRPGPKAANAGGQAGVDSRAMANPTPTSVAEHDADSQSLVASRNRVGHGPNLYNSTAASASTQSSLLPIPAQRGPWRSSPPTYRPTKLPSRASGARPPKALR
ncbi:hypothetical protein ACN47E_009990 [Coniothyrium glycines]